MPRSKPRDKVVKARADRTQASQEAAARAKVLLRRYHLRRVIGWSLVALGVLVGAIHVVEHTGFISVFPHAADGLYYPLAGALAIAGAIILSK